MKPKKNNPTTDTRFISAPLAAKLPNDWQLIQAKKQGITLMIGNKPLHSRIDPVSEAERWAARQTTGKADVIIVHEAGLMYHYHPVARRLMEIHKSSHGDTEQQNPDTTADEYKSFTQAQEKHDLSVKLVLFVNERNNLFQISNELEIFKKPKTNFPEKKPKPWQEIFVDPDNVNQICEILSAMDWSGHKGYRIWQTTVPTSPQKPLVLQKILQTMSSILSDLLTRVEFEVHWIKQIIQNAVNLKNVKPSQILFDQFQKKPALIIGAGPTLIESLPWLRKWLTKWPHQIIVVSTDTALGILLQNQIAPHIVYTLDSQKHSLKHFLPYFTHPLAKKIHLLADIVACPDVIARWPGPRWIATTAKYTYPNGKNGIEKRETTPMADWLESHSMTMGDIQSGGSVATSAFDLVRQMGAKPVIFLGQDLAYVDREIHAQGTHHLFSWLSSQHRLQNLDHINQAIINKRSIQWIPSLRSQIDPKFKNEKVITDYVFHLYRHWFEEAFAITGMPIVFPANKGGIMLGTRILDYPQIESLLQQNIQLPAKTLNELWLKAEFISDGSLRGQLQALKQFLHQHLKDLRSDQNQFSDKNQIWDHKKNITDQYPFMEVFFRKLHIYSQRNASNQQEPKQSIAWQNVLSQTIFGMEQLLRTLEKTLGANR